MDGLGNLPDILTAIGKVVSLAEVELSKSTPCLYDMGKNDYQFGEYDTITPIYYFDSGTWKQIMFN
jgi:hypothetical protein